MVHDNLILLKETIDKYPQGVTFRELKKDTEFSRPTLFRYLWTLVKLKSITKTKFHNVTFYSSRRDSNEQTKKTSGKN